MKAMCTVNLHFKSVNNICTTAFPAAAVICMCTSLSSYITAVPGSGSAYLWVFVYNSHLNSIRVMLVYVASSPTGSNSTLVCGTVAPGDQQSDVWHAVAHGCFPAQHQSGISRHVQQAHATWNFNADTKGTRILLISHPGVLWDFLHAPDLYVASIR